LKKKHFLNLQLWQSKRSYCGDVEKCKGCSVCVPACPKEVIELAKEVNAKAITMPI
jgi:Pyruvate/2-oxoacid:ferredoxin oxidoreductase delta subunit